MLSQLAKWSSQNVDSGVGNNKYFRSTWRLTYLELFSTFMFIFSGVSGERLISHGTYR